MQTLRGELPDPDGGRDLDELVGQLRLLKMWAGDPSYEVITRRIAADGAEARKSTVADCFRIGRRRLNAELVLAIVRALQDQPEYVERWQRALRVVAGESEASAHISVEAGLPEDLAGFTGRTAELATLQAELARTERPVVITAIEGMAGVGKTRFAVHAGHLLAADKPFDQVLFVNLRGFHEDQPPADPMAVLDGFLRLFRVPASKIPRTLTARTAAYREHLAGTRTLVVLDNAADENQVSPLLPQTPGCLTLLTSRRSLAGLEDAIRLAVDVFAPHEAVAFLDRALPGFPIGPDPQATARIAARCGYLPLALSLVAAYISTTNGWTLSDHADRLDERHETRRLDSAVELALDVSYQHLPADHRRMFRLVAQHPGQGFDVYAAAALADTDLLSAQEILDDLQRDHLLIRTGPDRYTFHDLVRAYAGVRAADEERSADRRAALTRLFDLYLGTASQAMDVLHPLYAARRPKVATPATPVPVLTGPADVVTWLESEYANLVATAIHAAGHGWPSYTSQLSMTLDRYLNSNLRSGALTIHRHAYRAARQADDLVGEARALINLGIIHERTFRAHESQQWFELALSKFARIDDPVGTATALNGLGNLHAQLNQWDRSAHYLGRGLTEFRRIGDRDGQALILSNLANVHKRTADYPRAIATLREALGLYEDLGNLDGQAAVLHGLGVVHELACDFAPAAEYAGRALELFRQVGNRRGVARALLAVGTCGLRAGEYDEARAHLLEALASFREIDSPGGEGGALDALGELWTWVGDPARAIEYFEQALEIFRAVGARDAESASLNGLGEAAHDQARYADAVSLFTEALAISSEVSSTAQQARAHVGLGHALRALGDPDGRCESHRRQGAAIYESLGMAPLPSPAER